MRGHSKNKTIHFLFLNSINRVILISVAVALILFGLVLLILNSQNKLEDPLAIITIINVLLISLPLVLFILCVIYSAIISINLSKQNIFVKKLSHFESLLKIDVVCLEKDNVITDGNYEIKKVIPLQAVATEQYINQWLSNLLRATNDNGAIFDALNKKYDFELSAGVVDVLHYNDQLKYNGASFKGGKTLVLGNPEFAPVKNKVGILKRCEEDISKGYQILVLAEGKEKIDNDGYHGELEGIVLLVLKNHVRDDAFETFKWFKNNGIETKVISADDPLAASVSAAEAGIEGADKHISLDGIDVGSLKDIVTQYTVFGNASSEQKKAIVDIIKEEQNVMMIGSGEADVLSMNASNFAISTNDDSQKAADVVLNDSSLKSLPLLINNSKVFVGNFQKILSLSMIKTFIAFILVLFFVGFNDNLKQCLFVFNHLLLWDFVVNGAVSLFLMFDKKNKKVDHVLLKTFIKNVVPAAILETIGIATVFVLYALQINGVISFGIYSLDIVSVMCVLLISLFGIAILYNVCAPLNRQRKMTVVIGAIVSVLSISIIVIIAYLSGNADIPYLKMSGPAYFITALIAVLCSAIYLFVSRIIDILKGENLEDEN